LAERGFEISHSDSLELVAKQFGFDNWNILAAKIGQVPPAIKLVMPAGWITSGSRPEQYEMGVDPSEAGSPAVIRCIIEQDTPGYRESGFATMMQTINAGRYRGHRLRLRAELMTENVSGAGTIWMRVDGSPSASLRFDNMVQRKENGSLKGSVPWSTREIVLDIPDEAGKINFGFFQQGAGTTRARAFNLSEVGSDVPETAGAYPDEPVNLDFKPEE
jgi:hypothetical protein